MGLTDKLRDLDQRLLPGTREPEEDAEAYLRRVAASRAITPAQAGDVMAALRAHFGVEQGQASEGEEDQSEEADESKQSDEAEPAKDESEESEESESEESEKSEKSEDDDES
jgi:hypothetical protein